VNLKFAIIAATIVSALIILSSYKETNVESKKRLLIAYAAYLLLNIIVCILEML